jgi:hypothetical protein
LWSSFSSDYNCRAGDITKIGTHSGSDAIGVPQARHQEPCSSTLCGNDSGVLKMLMQAFAAFFPDQGGNPVPAGHR